MKSANSKKASLVGFGFIALVVLIGVGLFAACYAPEIKSWQISQSDKIIALASRSSGQEKQSLLEQATLVNPGDPLATEYLANYYVQKGDYRKAIQAYQAGGNANLVYLGNMALKVGDYKLARQLFSKEAQKGESAEAYAGLALAGFASGDDRNGCDNAEKARKLNLSSQAVADVAVICSIKQGSSNSSTRQQAYAYAKVGLYSMALDLFSKTETKTTGDWLLISDIYKVRGDNGKSLEALKSGLSQDPTNKQLLSTIITELKSRGDTNETEKYEIRLNDLEFKNYP